MSLANGDMGVRLLHGCLVRYSGMRVVLPVVYAEIRRTKLEWTAGKAYMRVCLSADLDPGVNLSCGCVFTVRDASIDHPHRLGSQLLC